VAVNRRRFVQLAARAAASLAVPSRGLAQGAAAIVPAEHLRPQLPSGVQVGDVTADRAIIWSRTDRPARLIVEYAYDESGRDAQTIVGPTALENSSFTARLDLGGLRPGEPVFYRVRFDSLEHPGTFSEPVEGRFRTAPIERRDITVMWSADTVGQGWGISPEFGGLRLYETMMRHAPDVFIHSGDMIYADAPLRETAALPDGSVWRNLVTPAKAKIAETLDEFRGNFAYNLLDAHMRRFNAAVPLLAQWDDHEVMNNWFPGLSLDADSRYAEKSVALLAARAKRAMFEFVPFRTDWEAERIYRAVSYGPLLEILLLDERSYRGPNTPNRQSAPTADTAMLGGTQVEWLKARLLASRATWKVIASDMPIGLMVRDGTTRFDAWANGDGPPLGRELEMANLLAFVKRHEIRNTVWITGDVHYAAAHRYDPGRAVFTDFEPFWEFVAGPLHAGTFGPSALDPTFGPDVRFQSSQPGMPQNRPPSDGQQFFGTLRVDARSQRLTAALWNLAGDRIFSVDLDPSDKN
jgi:alkaline phosphatase D